MGENCRSVYWIMTKLTRVFDDKTNSETTIVAYILAQASHYHASASSWFGMERFISDSMSIVCTIFIINKMLF